MWHLEADEVTAADMACRHELLLGGGEENILVDLEWAGADFLDLDVVGAAKALEFVRLDHDGADLQILNLGGGDLVVEVILTGDADRHRLELHVEILCDEDGRILLALHERDAGGHDAVIDWFLVREDLGEAAHGGRETLASQGIIDVDADGAATGGLDSLGDLLGLVVEDLGQKAMDGACIGSSLGLLVLEAVEFTEYLDGDEEVVVFKEIETVRVMQQDIGVEDEVFHEAWGFRSIPFGWRWEEKALFFCGIHRGGSVHDVVSGLLVELRVSVRSHRHSKGVLRGWLR